MSMTEDMLRRMRADDERLRQTETKESLGNIPGFTSFYEVGAWTPVFAGTGTPGTWTYTTQFGRYTRIGNRVLFNCLIVAATRPGAPTGSATITGLPLTSEATANNFHPCALEAGNLTLSATNTMITARVPPNATRIDIFEVLGTAPATAAQLAATGLTATAIFECSGHYQV